MSIQLVVVSGERLNSGVHISHMKWKEFVQAKREINNTSYILGTVWIALPKWETEMLKSGLDLFSVNKFWQVNLNRVSVMTY